MDHTSRPDHSPTAIPEDVVEAIMALRTAEKWGAQRIAAHLAEKGIVVSGATVYRTLKRNSVNRVRDMDPPTGEPARIHRYEHDAPGDMVHVDIKKVGRIPTGGGWAAHGRNTEGARKSKRVGKGTGRIGYAYLHSAVDDHSRFAYTEVLPDEKGPTAAGFWLRAAAYFVLHGITHIERVLTDNGSCYRSNAFAAALVATGSRHKRTRPYSPQTNGKVERYNQTMLAEWLRRRVYSSENDRTAALAEFLNYYNFERRHSALGWQPPATRVPASGPRMMPQEMDPEPPASDQLVLDGM